ncbi:MAG: SLBB domain-containing protein [Armatimonadota bacterium]|nr:SLBB domain-containing protein [Armatimonadota bacterium]MDR7452272.1 SLBB domain-containing protein [Armatimonadota bacterium]MDR7467964.1 SLBB domain-containing protein [Armatimonadota bacterium]MDR7494806.1 SLBB domain-containing protein [Armatimonadota bacterium]MDR7499240.1 SLBB domain-containing protein [Armatimonadota bacterium]
MRVKSAAILTVVAVLITLAAGGPVSAQPAVQPNYILGPGDTIDIMVYGEPDLTRTVTIKPDGAISLPLLGEVKAAGKTTTQLANELARLYSKYLKSPSVSVTVREFRVDRIYILGQVSRPGEYPLRPGVGIMELLASAGGPTNRADLAKIVVIRGRTEAQQLNLLEALASNRNPDVKLQPGDVLFIPETDKRIVVLGQVNRPGAYDLLEGQRVSDLLAAAGGITPRAAPQASFIVRGQQQIPVDLQKVLAGDMAANVVLQPGDMMVVPESQNRIAVMGAVNNPGTFALTENMKLIDALALAGGPTQAGRLTNVIVVRVEGGQVKRLEVNLERAMTGQDASQNIPLQSGDIVFVPDRFTVGTAGQWLNLFNLIRLVFRGW